MVELLAPAGTMPKLKTALYYGADAVYIAGQNFGLRSYAGNFTDAELAMAVEYTHARSKKLYVTVNIFAKNDDFAQLKDYAIYLYNIGVDAVIVTDSGVIDLFKEVVPKLELHLSTQANTTNYRTVKFWGNQGVARVVLARELSLAEIRQINDNVPSVETEIFVHGAMCISYSGRCLLSNYLNGRDSNRGECVQACRWSYKIAETSRDMNDGLEITEDNRGTYLMNSKDLNMLEHLKEVLASGVTSLKIEGRMKSEYYVATVINAYRRAIDLLSGGGSLGGLVVELSKTSHRQFTTAYYLGKNDNTVCSETAKPIEDYKFIAEVIGYDNERKLLEVEMRNRFRVGDTLEVLSPNKYFNNQIEIIKMYDQNMCEISDAKFVQQRIYIETDMQLSAMDMLRQKTK